MAEDVAEVLEKSIPELELYEAHNLLSTMEIQEIVRKRKAMEYRMKRREQEIIDYRQAVDFERNLLSLLEIRAKKVSHDESIHRRFVPTRICFILSRALTRFKDDESFCIEAVETAKEIGSLGAASKFCTLLLRLFPLREVTYVMAAEIQLLQGDYTTGRKLFQQGLSLLPKSVKLWTEYFILESQFLLLLKDRKDKLKLNEDDKKRKREAEEDESLLSIIINNFKASQPDNEDIKDFLKETDHLIDSDLGFSLLKLFLVLLDDNLELKANYYWKHFDRLKKIGLVEDETKINSIECLFQNDKRGLINFLTQVAEESSVSSVILEASKEEPNILMIADYLTLIKIDAVQYLPLCLEKCPSFPLFNYLSLSQKTVPPLKEFKKMLTSLDKESFLFQDQNYAILLWLLFIRDNGIEAIEEAILSIKRLTNEAEVSNFLLQLFNKTHLSQQLQITLLKRVIKLGVPSVLSDEVYIIVVDNLSDIESKRELLALSVERNNESSLLWRKYLAFERKHGTLEQQNSLYLRAKSYIR